jgi:hypothetical protein
MKKEEQRRYDLELSRQLSEREQRSRSSSFSQGQGHNPITNPISFKIDPYNPYVVKEYENAKSRMVGDPHLKLGNLATVGRTMTKL